MSGVTALRVGIAGLGGAGLAQFHHFQAIAGCQVSAIYDPDPRGRERARALPGPHLVLEDFAGLLAGPIDAVAVCSPDRTHADYVSRALRAGKDVLCEKPLADSLEGCAEILRAERESPGAVLAVQHQMRHLPVHQAMRRVVRAGRLGRIGYVEGYYVHDLTERASLYHRWRFEDRASPLVYSGCHFVDLVRWLLADEVAEVAGMSNNLCFPEYPPSDLEVVLLRMRSGVVAKVVTAFGAGRPQDHSVRVYGSDASIENNLLFSRDGRFELLARPLWRPTTEDGDPPLARLRDLRAHWKPVVLGRLFEAGLRFLGRGSEYTVQGYPLRLHEHALAVRRSVRDFVECVRERRRPECTASDAARTVAVCLAGVEACRSGRTVPLARYAIAEPGSH